MKKTIITYTSRKTSKVYNFEGTINEGSTYVLIDADGGKHLYSESTLKKNFKKGTKEVEIKGSGCRKNVKGNVEHLEDDEVIMRAFTGMLIGVFKVVSRGDEVIAVEMTNGTRKNFSAETGKELNCKNPRYANRIDL